MKSKHLSDHWKDKDFVAEMNDRYREYKSGKANLISLDAVENKAKEIFIEKVKEGLKQINEGKTIPLDDVKKIVKEWRK